VQLDGLTNELENFLPRFGHGHAAGQVRHVSAVIPFGFFNDYHILHMYEILWLHSPFYDGNALPGEKRQHQAFSTRRPVIYLCKMLAIRVW